MHYTVYLPHSTRSSLSLGNTIGSCLLVIPFIVEEILRKAGNRQNVLDELARLASEKPGSYERLSRMLGELAADFVGGDTRGAQRLAEGIRKEVGNRDRVEVEPNLPPQFPEVLARQIMHKEGTGLGRYTRIANWRQSNRECNYWCL
ncbi:MAG: hypothetical protein L0338_09355 [Acidobacteria bacterium]|nr:hypothetical protein [Acidobacteriota bacterium]